MHRANDTETRFGVLLFAQDDAITGYLRSVTGEIDSNLVENSTRGLLIGHPASEWRSAVLYTLIVNCTRRGINPWEWLTDVFRRLPTITNRTAADLLPSRWRKPAA